MTIDWKDKAVQDRLLTAVIASMDNKVNIAEIARLYGQDMTYYALENYLRKVRKDAKDMKIAAADRDLPAPSPARPRTKKASSVSPVKAGVKSGRVTKNTLATPIKIKPETLEQDVFSSNDKSFAEYLNENIDEEV